MANTDATINTSNGRTTLSCGTVTLNYGDTLTIAIGTGFPAAPVTTQVERVEFYAVVNGQKSGPILGKWVQGMSPPSTLPAGIAVAASGSGVVLTNTDDGLSDDDYYFSVTAEDSNSNSYPADPELVLKKKTKPPTAQARRRPPLAPEA